MANILRQSTSIDVRIGPFVDVTDAVTPETGITLGAADQAEALKANGAATADISGNTWAAVTGSDGWYDLTLTTTDTNTVGELVIVVQDASVCLPVFARFQVMEEAVYDALFAASAAGYNAATPLDAAGVRSAVGLASANLDTQLGTIDTNVDAVLVDTDTTLPATLATLATSSALATVDSNVDAILVDTGTTIPAQLDSMSGATFDTATDSLEAIRNRGDAAWTTGAGGSPPDLLQNTTIATLASQTSFTLTAGSADDDAYNGALAVITDQSTSTQKAKGTISDYVGSTKTVTLSADPGIFTMAVGDTIDIIAVGEATATVNTAAIADAVLDEALSGHTTAGTLGKAIADIETDVTAVLVDTDTTLPAAIATVDSNVDAILVDTGTTLPATLATLATSSALATVDSNVDAILVDTGTTIPAQISALNDLSAAEVNAEVVDALATDTYAELGAVPAATSTLAAKINWLFMLARNKITQTATTQTVRNDADSGDVATSTVSDDGTTATRGEFS